MEAIHWRFTVSSDQEIGHKTGIAYQKVEKRLKTENWDEFSHGLTFIERILTAHLRKGA